MVVTLQAQQTEILQDKWSAHFHLATNALLIFIFCTFPHLSHASFAIYQKQLAKIEEETLKTMLHNAFVLEKGQNINISSIWVSSEILMNLLLSAGHIVTC